MSALHTYPSRILTDSSLWRSLWPIYMVFSVNSRCFYWFAVCKHILQGILPGTMNLSFARERHRYDNLAVKVNVGSSLIWFYVPVHWHGQSHLMLTHLCFLLLWPVLWHYWQILSDCLILVIKWDETREMPEAE